MYSSKDRLKSLFYLYAVIMVYIVFPGSEGKVIKGVTSSYAAWYSQGQFITKFCFHGKHWRYINLKIC